MLSWRLADICHAYRLEFDPENLVVLDGTATDAALVVEVALRSKALLVIAKLDRLSRKVSFVSNLMEAGVQFVRAAW